MEKVRRKSKLEEVLETTDIEDSSFRSRLREAEKDDDANLNYWDERKRYMSRMGIYHTFLTKNPEINSKTKWRKFFLGRIIHWGKKATLKYSSLVDAEVVKAKVGNDCIEFAKIIKSKNSGKKLIEKGIGFIHDAISRVGYRPDNVKSGVYGYAGNVFSEIFDLGGKNIIWDLGDSNLDSLLLGIISSELSEKFGNKGKVNYQVIGRERYDLQYLIEKTDINLLKEAIENVKNKMMSNADFRKYFSKRVPLSRFFELKDSPFLTIRHLYNKILCFEKENSDEGKEEIRKRDIEYARKNNEQSKRVSGLNLPKVNWSVFMGRRTKENPDDFKKELQFSVVHNALTAFVKSKTRGDYSPDNRSYRGMCLVDMVRLNNWLKCYDSKKVKAMLGKARILLENVTKEDISLHKNVFKERESRKKREATREDYTRLAECYFRLADGDITWDGEERKKLYEKVIDLNNLSIKHGSTISEVHSFIASSHLKLAELSSDNDEKKKHLEEAVTGFNFLFRKDEDNSAENRSKTGSCYLKQLEIILQENHPSDEVEVIVRKAKDALEEAVEVGKKRAGGFISPYCLLAELSDSISDNNICGYDGLTEKYNWKIVVEKLFENKKNLNDIFKSLTKEKVWIVDDEHGLMRRDLVIKENENVEELKQEFLRNKFVYDNMKDSLNLASDSVPFSRPISVIQKDGKSYFVMRRSRGINLNQKFKFFAGSYARVEENES